MNPNRSKAKQEKELADNARLLRAWKKFHREEREAVLAGPHGALLSELFRMFANIQHVAPAQLVGFVQSINWARMSTTPSGSRSCTKSTMPSPSAAWSAIWSRSTIRCWANPKVRFV